jgi:hypothetical protein
LPLSKRFSQRRNLAAPIVGASSPREPPSSSFDPSLSGDAWYMGKNFKVGDRVCWNSEAGYVSGRIIKIHTRDMEYKGYARHASEDEPQFEIASDKTDHIAMHKRSALQKID